MTQKLFPNLLSVYNEALLSVGEHNITDHDNSAFAAVFRGVAESIAKKKVMSNHWSWARKEEALILQGQDFQEWFIYQLPSDHLKTRRIHINEISLRDTKLLQNSVLINCPVTTEDIIIDYTYAAPVEIWAADFHDAMRMYFEGLIRKSVLRDYREGTADMEMANRMFIEAAGRDFNSTGSRDRNDGGRPFFARFGAGRHG